MEDISEFDKERFIKLVKNEIKTKILWAETVTGLSRNNIIKLAKSAGFLIDNNYIIDPEQYETNIIPTDEEIQLDIKLEMPYTVVRKEPKPRFESEEKTSAGRVLAIVSISLAILSIIAYAIPCPCIGLFIGLPVSAIALILSLISFISKYVRILSITSLIVSVLPPLIWYFAFSYWLF